MLLQLQSKIETELQKILKEAIQSEKLNPDSLRMVILSSNPSFEKLDVCICSNWDSYFSKEYATIIGEINISKWLDVADEALETLDNLDQSYLARAKEIEQKYSQTPPAIDFEHLANLNENYVAFLVCLREELLLQIETALSNVATTFSQTDFKHVVGFFTHNLIYKQNDYVLLHAFNHENGSGPFYTVQLRLPNYKYSQHYLKFQENNLLFFCVEGTLYESTDSTSEVYTYNLDEITFFTFEENEIHFRLNDEFENWILETRNSNLEKGDKSEQEFLTAFNELIKAFPDKIFDPKIIPNPLTEEMTFQNWLSIIIANNISLTLEMLKTIFGYGEDAYKYFLHLIPKTHGRYEFILGFLANRYFYLGRFQETIDLFQQVVKLSTDNKIQYITCLFILNQKEEFDAFRPTIDEQSEEITLEMLDDLWLLREPLETETLKNLEEKLLPRALEYHGYAGLRLISVVLTKLYVALNEPEKALFQIQSVPTFDTFEKVLFEHELQGVTYIIEAYKTLIQKTKERVEFDKKAEFNSLNYTERIKYDIKKTKYEECYYKKHEIRVENYEWAFPLSETIFMATRQINNPELILACISAEQTIEILQLINLPETIKISSGHYSDGILYLVDKYAGVITFSVTLESITENNLVYKNTKSKANYENLTISDGYLYASNNNYLEIYELNKPENLVSSSLYINSGYYLFAHKNLLVVGAGAGLLILADITDKTNPVCLSTINEDSTPGNMFVAFIGDYMISRSIYNIKNPSTPKWISYVCEEFAPTYYFTPQPEIPIISTAEEFLFTTLTFENAEPVYTNWLESLNSENLFYERVVYNLGTAYFEDRLVTYSKYGITLWEKGLAPLVEKIDVHHDVELMVQNCFQYLVEEHPSFCIGKVVLKSDPIFRHIEIAFHESSSLATLLDTDSNHDLPIIMSFLNYNRYCQDVLEQDYDSAHTYFKYDGDRILHQLVKSAEFEKKAARNVLVLSEGKGTFLHFASKPWKPFRSVTTSETEQTNTAVDEIILSKNENLILKLIQDLPNDLALLDSLLDIINKKVFLPHDEHELTNLNVSFEEDENPRTDFIAFLNDIEEGNISCLPSYISGPLYSPEIETKSEDVELPSDYILYTPEIYHLKQTAVEILCQIPDVELLRTIILNGIKYGYTHYKLDNLPTETTIDNNLIYYLINNAYQLWDKLGSDTDIRFLLMSNLDQLSNFYQKIKIVYKCGHLSHPLITEHIQNTLNEGLSFYTFKGHYSEIDFTDLPDELFKPFEAQLLEKIESFENATDPLQKIEADQQIIYVYELLNRLGHERIPELVAQKHIKAIKDTERYSSLFEDDDEYDVENIFLIKQYRKAKIKRLLNYYSASNGVLWPLEEALEEYEVSWKNTIEALFEEGKKIYGETFPTNYIERLVQTISGDETYAHNRELAYEFIQYTYNSIQAKPELASLAESLVIAIHENKDAFPKKLDISALKEKSKFTLLQAAWNDLKNKDWDLAEQKAEAILVMDPTMGQVYFLKARLLWLKEGIPAYLAQQETFIDKASHDIVSLARIYNLTGCAFDEEKRYEEALPYFKKAALSAPHEHIYVANVAEIYYKLGKSKEALKHAQAAKSNGNEADILKEIIKNKGVLSEV